MSLPDALRVVGLAAQAEMALVRRDAVAGALLVSIADMAVRLVPSGPELMLGVFTSLIGVPFFLWLVFRLRQEAA